MFEKKVPMDDLHLKFMMGKNQLKYAMMIKEGYLGRDLENMGSRK